MSLPLHHSWKSLEMNSGPLSHLMLLGLPLSHITFSSVRITLLEGKDMDTSWVTATRSLSSMMLRTRNFLPHSSMSLTKSIDHVVLGSSGCSRGFLTLAGRRFLSLVVSRSACSCKHDTLSCGSTACRHGGVSRRSSRTRRRVRRLPLSPPQPPCRPFSRGNRSTTCVSPSFCTPERCSLHILPQCRSPVLS